MSKQLLNIGSGQRPFKAPWHNVDCNPKWNPDTVWDASRLHGCPFTTNSVSVIVLHHVLEHFGCGEAADLLRNCKDLLEPGGRLLVFVPDMWELTAGWREGKISDQIFLTNIYGAYMDSEADRHKWGFTDESLNKELKNAGFRYVLPYTGVAPQGADIAQDWWILGREAVK